MTTGLAQIKCLIGSPRLRWQILLGLSEGLPLALITTTLQAWLADRHVDITSIGLLTMVSLPYTLKPLWAPVMDRFCWPFLDRRRGWVVVAQVGLLISLLALATCQPQKHLLIVAAIALLAAIFGATQDIAIDAYRTDTLLAEERGLASALFVGGWRIGALLASGVALIVAHYLGWAVSYAIFASLMLLGVVATLASPSVKQSYPPATLISAVVEPFQEFWQRHGAILMLLIVVTYKLGNAFALSLITAFLIKHVGFSLQTVGSVSKIYGAIATIGGMMLGGAILVRCRLYTALLGFGVLQLLANASYMSLAWWGQHYSLLVTAVTVEHLTSGMATAAFLAFLMSLCDVRYTAFQFALLSSLDSLGRTFLGPIAGLVAHHWGWMSYFITSIALGVPGLVLLVVLQKRQT